MPSEPVRSTFDIMQWMDPTMRAAFEDAIRQRRYAAGQLIYTQGDQGTEMYRIRSGEVRLSVMSSDGRDVVYLRFGAGDCFGESSLIDGEVRPHTAEAVADVEAEVLDLAAFRKLRDEHRGFDEALLQLLSRQMRFSSGLFLDLSLNELPGRIARRILQAAQGVRAERGTHPHIRLPLPQSEIASMVSASRQTVNRILQQMQREGIIATEYNMIVITDFDRLRDMAARENTEIVAQATE